MRREAVAVFVVVLVAVSAGAGYFAGVWTAAQPPRGPTSECDFTLSCSVKSPSGIVLTMSIWGTTVRPNTSLTFEIDEFNPTSRVVNLSYANSWDLLSLRSTWRCFNGAPPYGIAAFRGYYTLQNITSAKDVLLDNKGPHSCPASVLAMRPTVFSMSPWSNRMQVRYDDGWNMTLWGYNDQIFIVNYGTTSTPDMPNISGGFLLGSTQPGVYTIVGGDEWGALLLFHFSVKASG